jgi:hypothetical protein
MKNLFRIYYICLAVSVAVGLLMLHFHMRHIYFWWQGIPAFFAIFGFIGCVLLIVVSKALGHHWLMKDEDYYEKH